MNTFTKTEVFVSVFWLARLGGGVAALWSGASLVCRVFLGSSLKTERSATYCSLVFRVGLGELFVSHGITHRQPRFQPS